MNGLNEYEIHYQGLSDQSCQELRRLGLIPVSVETIEMLMSELAQLRADLRAAQELRKVSAKF